MFRVTNSDPLNPSTQNKQKCMKKEMGPGKNDNDP